jgi:Putative rRNA methylase
VIYNDSNPHVSLVKLAHGLIKEKVKPGDIVIDATVGNGHDTVFLLDLVKPNGRVYGFDIQQTAIDSALTNLQDKPFIENLTLIRASHAEMCENIPPTYHGKISAVMFNLGFLPGGDKEIITQAGSTLIAVDSARLLLSANGIITILAYPGHEGGEIETDQVKNWCLALDPRLYEAKLLESDLNNPSAPKLFVVNKISQRKNK